MKRSILPYTFIMAACTAVSSIVNGQGAVIDSLQRLLKVARDDSSRVEILMQLGKNYDNVDTAKARGYWRELARIADESGDEILSGYADELGGVLYTKYDEAMAMGYYNAALNKLQKHATTIRVKRSIASIANNLGVIHFMNADYEGALRYFMEGVKFYEQNDPNNANIGFGYGNITSTYGALDKLESSLVYSTKGIEFAKRINNKNLLMTAYGAQGGTLLKLKRYDEFRPYLEKQKEIALELKNIYNLYLYYINVGDYYYYTENYMQAIAQYQEALEYSRKIDSRMDIGFSIYGIGASYLGMKEYTLARKYLNDALDLGKKENIGNLLLSVYESLSELGEATRDYKSALVYKNHWLAIRDSSYSESNVKRIEFMDAQYQAEKNEKNILQLQKDKQDQSFTLRQKSTLNYILFGSVAVLLMLGFLGYRIFRTRQKLARQQDIVHQQRIRELEKDRQLLVVDSLLKGQEEERSRLAKDLHDGLGGLLSGVKFSLSNMKDNLIVTPENMAVFERSLDMLDNSIRELRRVAHNMMPEMLTKFGLDEALKEYCNSISATGLLAVKYQSFGMTERLENPTEIIVYRIVQELLNNTLKHAGASEVLVQLIREGTRVSVLVEDNGKGFDVAGLDTNRGAGWTNIRSRVEYLKGRVDINSDPQRGTSVNIEFNT